MGDKDDNDEKDEKGSVGDTMEHALVELAGGLLPGGSKGDTEDEEE